MCEICRGEPLEGLTRIRCHSCYLTTIEYLPDTLIELNLGCCAFLHSIPDHLPPNLEILILNHSALKI